MTSDKIKKVRNLKDKWAHYGLDRQADRSHGASVYRVMAD